MKTTKKKPPRSNFWKLRLALGLDRDDAAKLCGVSLRTITNWDRDGAPAMAETLLYSLTSDLGSRHPDWRGFKIGVNGKLYGPNRLQLSAEHLRHYPDTLAELDALRRELRRCREAQSITGKIKRFFKR